MDGTLGILKEGRAHRERRSSILRSFGILCVKKTKEGEKAPEGLTVRKIGGVLRLKWACGRSNRAIARSCSISHSTVGECVQRAEDSVLDWRLTPDLDEDGFLEILFLRPLDSSSRVTPCPEWS